MLLRRTHDAINMSHSVLLLAPRSNGSVRPQSRLVAEQAVAPGSNVLLENLHIGRVRRGIIQIGTTIMGAVVVRANLTRNSEGAECARRLRGGGD